MDLGSRGGRATAAHLRFAVARALFGAGFATFFTVFFAACAFRARVVGDRASRVARSFRLVVRFARPVLLRVDFREGRPVAESSRAAPVFFATRLEVLRVAVDFLPTLRSVALVRGFAVSTGVSRRGLAARFGFGGRALRAAAARACSAFVAIAASVARERRRQG